MQKTVTQSLLKVSLVANIFEWYEFSIYSYLATTFGQLFFKSTHPTIALIQSFALFASSYFMRPIGALFFGTLGDKTSPNNALHYSLVIMATPTVLIGLLPTYDQIGSLATLSLIILRLVQGFGAGGELPVSGCWIFEQSSIQKRGILCSTTIVGASAGVLLSSRV